jgi:hypothetical protein
MLTYGEHFLEHQLKPDKALLDVKVRPLLEAMSQGSASRPSREHHVEWGSGDAGDATEPGSTQDRTQACFACLRTEGYAALLERTRYTHQRRASIKGAAHGVEVPFDGIGSIGLDHHEASIRLECRVDVRRVANRIAGIV